MARIKNQLLNVQNGIKYLKDQKLKEYQGEWNHENISAIDTALFGLIYYSFIWYHSFIEEFSKHFKSEDKSETDKIRLIRRHCNPFIKAITTRFGDIRQARNKILAHGYRDKNRPLTKNEINQYYNSLIGFTDLEPYNELSKAVAIIFEKIQSELGSISDEEISLQ